MNYNDYFHLMFYFVIDHDYEEFAHTFNFDYTTFKI